MSERNFDTDGGATCLCGKSWDYGDIQTMHSDADYGDEFEIECACGVVVRIYAEVFIDYHYEAGAKS